MQEKANGNPGMKMKEDFPSTGHCKMTKELQPKKQHKIPEEFKMSRKCKMSEHFPTTRHCIT